MQLSEKNKKMLDSALEALKNRNYYSPFPENPKAYKEDADALAKNWISQIMNNNYTELDGIDQSSIFIGEEVSPFLQVGIGVKYPVTGTKDLIANGEKAHLNWSSTDLDTRAELLLTALERIATRFFDIAYATMHTTGQSYMMSFQASGPHANDRALEAIAMGYQEMSRYASKVEWKKPMGKFDLTIDKTFNAIPIGLSLVIGCSTFPVWNTVPGLFASLITGNAVIVKPHAKAVLPIAIVVTEIQKLLKENGFNAAIVQLAIDSIEAPITKELAEHKGIVQIDYTGNSGFGDYIESLNKVCFTEKAGVNSIIIDSVKDLKAVAGNIAFAASLYSGQMCTAPQNIFIPETGITGPEGNLSYDEVVAAIKDGFNGLIQHPKAGPGTIGAIQADATLKRVQSFSERFKSPLVASSQISNEEFKDARIASPIVIELDAQNELFNEECFGPIVFIIKTKTTSDSLQLAYNLAKAKGALTCGAYSTNEEVINQITQKMNSIFIPVSFNFNGAGFINSHAAFSDFHLTGGNKAGNASFTNAEFINKRFVWVGNRYMN